MIEFVAFFEWILVKIR